MIQKKAITTIAIAAIMGAGILGMSSSAEAISLKQSSVITGEIITLGDIFHDLPANHDKVLGAAPRPGQDMVLNARTLLRIAMASNLPWKPASGADHVVLRRSATLVDRGTIESAIKSGLLEQGVSGNFRVRMPENVGEIILPADMPATAEVSHITYRRENNSFEAIIAAPSREEATQTIRVSGTIQPMIDIPVLRDSARNGTIISRHDIEYVAIPKSSVVQEIILSEADLVGATPRRILMAGQPIRASEIEAPKLVGRGEAVTLVFRKGALQLTARGRAMQHGAKGDVIRVVNTGSNKAVDGIVTASNEVTVETF